LPTRNMSLFSLAKLSDRCSGLPRFSAHSQTDLPHEFRILEMHDFLLPPSLCVKKTPPRNSCEF
jgi:hypothetical protein